jgi:UDP-glucose 4-epimerase
VPHIIAPPRDGDPPQLFANARKAKEVLGWEPQFSIEQIVEGACRWEKQLPDFLNGC